MTDFYKMTLTEITKELDRYTLQIMRQRADKIPLTPAQIRRLRALSRAYKTISAEVAK